MIRSLWRLDSAFNNSLAWSAACSMISLFTFILAYIRNYEYIVKRLHDVLGAELRAG